MKKIVLPALLITILSLAACSTSEKAIVPLSDTLLLDDTYTIIWNGVSQAYRYENGNWTRAENYDYQFSVIQKRYEDHWKSIKTLHRVHPDYDGKAGERDQTMYFEVMYQDMKDSVVQSVIKSSLGKGTGTSDVEFRNACLSINIEDSGPFMPFNKIRITQQYRYEEGLLTETVELIREEDCRETPFMKNIETAYIYLKGRLDKAPAIYKN